MGMVRHVKLSNSVILVKATSKASIVSVYFIKSTQETISQTTFTLCNFWHET